MSCDRTLQTQALFDGELDSAAALAAESHVAECPICGELADDLSVLRQRIGQARYFRAGEEFRARLARMIAAEEPARRRAPGRSFLVSDFFRGAFLGAGASALAAALALLLVAPSANDMLTSDLLNAHQRSLMANHLIDVASSDRHTVKPWFAGHADVSPPTLDFSGQGYRLIGGRVDYVDGRRASVVVYGHGAHIVNLFAWPASRGSLPQVTTREGYHIACWNDADLTLCAVSDTGMDEIETLERLIKDATRSDGTGIN
jgi:anti-sigma factor RsiW